MRTNHVAFVLLLLPCTASAAERVPIRFDVPSGLERYSGHQPVTFGVPFERGLLSDSHGVRLVDSTGRVLPAQFEVSATWAPESDQIRWLLVDLLVEIRNGHVPQTFLEFGPDVPKTKTKTDLEAQTLDGEVAVDTGIWRFTLGRQRVLGQYALTDGTGKVYRAGDGDGTLETTFEKAGPVRAVVKSTGDYVAEDGSSIAQFVTRTRFYANCPFVRVFHTMIWLKDANTQIGRLSFRSEAVVENSQAMAGVDGKRIGPGPSIELAQNDWNVVQGSANGRHLDGWIQVSNNKESLFASLRWPWQQFPTGLSASDGHIELQLIGPEKPMSLKAEDVAVEYVRSQMETWNLRIFDDQGLWSMKYNGPDARPHVSPRGVARTYEMLLWYDTADSPVTPEQKNILAQHPILAYADPAFATQANLPSPMSPRDPDRFPMMESALDRAFDWFTRERAFDGDFGTWNFGDVQWAWIGRGGYTTYRYWMNHGKGWSILPWALWLRSGDRKYWENGEINSRHVMDVDTCHVPEWKIAADGKVRGGQYHYSAIHWGYGPQVSTFYVDSEYLPYCYYVTGYERARDVMLERVEALARDDWKARVEHFKAEPDSRSRHLYAVVKDLAALYEATWDEPSRRARPIPRPCRGSPWTRLPTDRKASTRLRSGRNRGRCRPARFPRRAKWFTTCPQGVASCVRRSGADRRGLNRREMSKCRSATHTIFRKRELWPSPRMEKLWAPIASPKPSRVRRGWDSGSFPRASRAVSSRIRKQRACIPSYAAVSIGMRSTNSEA